jgi:hypothetical protein
MRTLNRPMFRYGGPIKEGVMSGIREPKKNGGPMKAALVGNPIYPKTNGREHHAVMAAVPAAIGLNALRTGAMRFLPRIFQGAKRIFGTTTPAKFTRTNVRPTGLNAAGSYSPVISQPAKFNPNYLGRDPLVRTIGATGRAIFNPTMGGLGAKAVRLATSPSTLIIGGLYYANGRWFNKDGSPANKEDIAAAKESTGGPPGGGDPGMQGDGSFFAEQAEKEALAKKQKALNNRIKRYRDIMDIKGMNKQAAYKSLIDASKLIQESQDFKGDIKSGKLINQVIQAASKQFDKPVKTSDAVNTLILQNELKKDLSAETDALAKEKTLKQIAVYDKQLKGDSTSEVIQAIALRTGMPQGDQLNQLVSLNNPELNLKTIPTQDMGQKDPITYIAEIVSSVNNDPSTPNYPAGNYVIKDKVVQITEEGNITPIPINQLK